MNKSEAIKSALKNVRAWLRKTVLEEGEDFVVFTDKDNLSIRILNQQNQYRDECPPKNTIGTLPLREKRKGVNYTKCPKCGKKGMRDVAYVMNPIERQISIFKHGGRICKYCGYAEYLEAKEGKLETIPHQMIK